MLGNTMGNFKRDREAMDRAAKRLLDAERARGNNQITHKQIKQRIIEAVNKRDK